MEPIRILELFAGQARLSKLAESLGMPSHAHDLLLDDDFETCGKSCMDINSSAGFVFLEYIIHQGRLTVIGDPLPFWFVSLLYLLNLRSPQNFYNLPWHVTAWLFTLVQPSNNQTSTQIILGILGLRLAIISVLVSADNKLLCLMGIKCSSWVSVNVGTSMRCILNPMGDTSAPSVLSANMMVARLGLSSVWNDTKQIF